MGSKILYWLQGRKTYILCALLCVVALALLMTGEMTPARAFTVLLLFASASSVTLRAALERHHDETMAVLQDVASLGIALRAKQPAQERAAAVAAVQGAVALANEVRNEGGV